jgi:hypothetical protein
MAASHRRNVLPVKRFRRNSSRPLSSTRSIEKEGESPSYGPRMHVDYDEAQTAEERGNYQSPIHLPFEGLADVHPIARLQDLLRRRSKRSR